MQRKANPKNEQSCVSSVHIEKYHATKPLDTHFTYKEIRNNNALENALPYITWGLTGIQKRGRREPVRKFEITDLLMKKKNIRVLKI